MQSAALVLIAALAFAGVAIQDGWREAYPSCPAPDYVIRYLPQTEPQPIYPAPTLLPVDEIGAPKAEPKETPVAISEDDPPSVPPSHLLPFSFRHHARHRRHWRRH